MAAFPPASGSSVADSPVSRARRDVLDNLYAPIADELARVRTRYRELLASDEPPIANLLAYVEGYSGKMLRPALLLLAAKACGSVRDEHITLAVVAEMLHTATLVHDDILDDADTRRQRPSINRLAGNETTVLLGDHLFSHALAIALSIDDPTGARHFSRAVSRTCSGEILQVHHHGDLSLSEATYMRIVQGKTAELYATSAELGALYAGAGPDAGTGMYRYGLNLGIAFQIMDDVLDLRGDEATVGKTLGTDLEGGKATLPIIHAIAARSGTERERFLALIRRGAVARAAILADLEESRSIDYAEQRAREIVSEAKEALAFLGVNHLRAFFGRIADFVITRQM